MIIGVRDFYIAIMTSEDTKLAAPTYDTPELIEGLQEIGIEGNSSLNPVYADDGVFGVIEGKGEFKLSFMLAQLNNYFKAKLQGSDYNSADDSIAEKPTDSPPYFAIMFRSLKSNDEFRYKVFYKCKMSLVKESFKTKEPTPTLSTPTFDFMAINRRDVGYSNGSWDEPTFTGGSTFFNSVKEFTKDSVLPTVVVDPLNTTTDVAINKTPKWTFSEEMDLQTLTDANFKILKSSDHSLVDGELAISTTVNTNDTVTFTPDVDFDNSETYIMICNKNVQDKAGNNLANDSITYFTTIAA